MKQQRPPVGAHPAPVAPPRDPSGVPVAELHVGPGPITCWPWLIGLLAALALASWTNLLIGGAAVGALAVGFAIALAESRVRFRLSRYGVHAELWSGTRVLPWDVISHVVLEPTGRNAGWIVLQGAGPEIRIHSSLPGATAAIAAILDFADANERVTVLRPLGLADRPAWSGAPGHGRLPLPPARWLRRGTQGTARADSRPLDP